MTTQICGNKCSVEYDNTRKDIFVRDLTDHYNEPAMYTKSKRGLKNAWAEIQATFIPAKTTLHEISNIFDKYKIKHHYFCCVD